MTNMRIIPHGAAQEVTGTCHELQVGDKRILLDCGLFQGHRTEAAAKNAGFEFDITKISALVLSHAHMDHVGRIPLLYKKGYRGPVFCTFATRDLAAVMLKDGGYIQEKDEEFYCKHLAKSMMQCDGPLYTQQDAIERMRSFQGREHNEWFDVCPSTGSGQAPSTSSGQAPSIDSGQARIRVQFLEAGHILGAAMVLVEATENGVTRRIGFSADLGRSTLPIIRPPAAMPPVEVLLCESTYGNRRHEDIQSAGERLREVIVKTAQRGGKVIIPAFSLERTQEIVYDFHLLWDAKKIPAIPIVIDSPLAESVTGIFMKHPECYDKAMYEQFLSRQHHPFQFSLVRYTASVEESKALNTTPGPMVIMAASGMCEAGRIRHHLRNAITDPRNTILAVGYMAENTLGRKIFDPAVGQVRIFDELLPKRAEVSRIDAYSGHADMDDLDRYVQSVSGLKKVILVHGELDQMEPFAQRIKHTRGIETLMPMREEQMAFSEVDGGK